MTDRDKLLFKRKHYEDGAIHTENVIWCFYCEDQIKEIDRRIELIDLGLDPNTPEIQLYTAEDVSSEKIPFGWNFSLRDLSSALKTISKETLFFFIWSGLVFFLIIFSLWYLAAIIMEWATRL